MDHGPFNVKQMSFYPEVGGKFSMPRFGALEMYDMHKKIDVLKSGKILFLKSRGAAWNRFSRNYEE